MPRTVSAAALSAILAQDTAELFLTLLTIDHADLAVPIRIADDRADHDSRGETYIGFPFRFTLPEDSDEAPAPVRLEIDNVDRKIVKALRALTSPADVTMEVVLASSPDTVEAGPFDMVLRTGDWNPLVVEGTLSADEILDEPYPADGFTPGLFPALFA